MFDGVADDGYYENHVKIHFINPCDKFLEKRGDRIPLGILQLSAWCKQYGHQTKIWDLNHDDLLITLSNMIEEKPEMICMTVTTPNYRDCIDLAKILKCLLPSSTLIAGGTHVTDFPEEPETLNHFDKIIVGNGENALVEIAKRLSETIEYKK